MTVQTSLAEPIVDAVSTSRDAALEFSGSNKRFRRLVTRGAAAELLTAGFYRFWLATAIRRMLWSDTSLEGEPFEYHGTGRELFFGFLVATAILAPAYFFYGLLSVEAANLAGLATVPFGLAYIAFLQFARYRSRRYRLTRTTWRGLRFGMTGSGWKYSGIALFWYGLAIVSLGFALPWATAALERYKMRHTFYGDLEGRFDGTGRQFFRRAWWLWVAPLAFLALGGTAGVWLIPPGQEEQYAPLLGGVLLIPAAIGVPFLYGAYKAIEWRWWVEGIRLGGIHASSTLEKGAVIGNYWKMIGVANLIALAGLAIAGAIAGSVFGLAAVSPSGGAKGLPVIGIVFLGLTYIATLLAIGVALRIYFIQRIWKMVCRSTTVHNAELADNVVSRPSTSNALGEGFADNLDVLGV